MDILGCELSAHTYCSLPILVNWGLDFFKSNRVKSLQTIAIEFFHVCLIHFLVLRLPFNFRYIFEVQNVLFL